MGVNCSESKLTWCNWADFSNEQGQAMLSIAEFLRVMKFEYAIFSLHRTMLMKQEHEVVEPFSQGLP